MREQPHSFDEIIEKISSPSREKNSRGAAITPFVETIIGHALGIDDRIVHSISIFVDHEVRQRPIRSLSIAAGLGIVAGAFLARKARSRRRGRYW